MLKPILATTLVISFLTVLPGCTKVISTVKQEPFEEDLRERSSGNLIDDQLLETKAQVNLDKAGFELEASNIDVSAYNGVVLLTGQVPNQAAKAKAEKVLREFKHVRRLHNHLRIAGKTSAVERSNDIWLGNKLKAKMLADTDIEGYRIKIVVEDSEVFLMGNITRQQGKEAINLTKRTGGVSKVYVLFEYID